MDHVEEEELPSGLSRKEMFGFGSFQNTLAMEVSNKSRVRRAEPSLLSHHEPVDMCLAFQEDDLFEELNSSVIGSVLPHAEALNEIPTASFSFASNMSAVAEPTDPVSYLCGIAEKESPSISLDNVCFTSLKKRKKSRKLPQIPPSQGFQPPTRDYIAATTWLAPPPAPEIQLGPGPPLAPAFQPALGDPPVLGLARPASGISPAFGGSLNQGFARLASGFPSDFRGVAAPVLVLSTLGISPAFGGSSAPGFAQPAPGFPSAFGGPPAPVLARSTLGISPAFGGSPAPGFPQPASGFPGVSADLAPPALGYPLLPGPPPPPPPAQELSQPHMGPQSKGLFAAPLYYPRSPAFSTTPHTLPPVIPESRSALFGAVAPQAEASYELSRLAYNNSNIAPEMTFDDSARNQPQEIVAPTTKARRADRTKFSVFRNIKALTKKSQPKKRFVPPSWSSLSSLQNEDGYWLLSEELCKLININVQCLTEDFLVKKGIKSLGSRGIDTIHKLIATLLVLQTIRAHNILSGITFKTLLKLDPSVPRSQYPSIEKAIEWAIKSDRQYPGICMRLGLGRDWDQATRQLLNLDPIPTTSDLHSVSHCLFLL
ncbi:hypothetical protein GDO81_004754 [Engystomops pustulosus]|uniref:PARP4 MVP-ID C-terminal domain-containing protein n=1 Tax=Engystomops pustulosus TaxID=76066 RepID=A0AAV7CJ82_ENGPU|nr:hypothetical protein GDO81_004754 [Engystomops pustulosus]